MSRTAADLSRAQARLVLAAAGLALFSAGIPQYLGPGASVGDDNSSHFAEILAVADRLSAGETDFWFDQANLGYPMFLAYQPAPAFVMGGLVAATRAWISPLFLFKLSILVLWSAMPAAWYVGGRWLGLRRLEALLFGLFVPGLEDFRAFGLGISSVLATGLYTQTWGALFLPLAIGSLFRLLLRPDRGSLRRATALLSLTLLCHVFLALYCGVAAAAMVAIRREEFWPRVRRLLAVGAATALATAFWLVPFLSNLAYQGGLPWKHESENGYPPASLLTWAFEGELFDHGRLPWLTLLVGVGLVVAWRRRSRPLARWVLVLCALTFALLLGRTTWGRAYSWLPFHGELEVIRYLSGLQFCGLLFAAFAGAAALDWIPFLVARLSGPRWLTPARTTTAIAAALTLGFLIGFHLHARGLLRTFDIAQPEFRGAIDQLSGTRGSRFLGHKRLHSEAHFYLNLLPALADRPQLQSFSRGYHDTLSVYYLEYFDFSEAAFRLYNVGAVIARGEPSAPLPDAFRKTWSSGEWAVYESDEAGGYFTFVRTPVTLVAEDLKAARPLLRGISLRLFAAGVLPRLARREPDGPWWRWPGGNHMQSRTPGDATVREAPATEMVDELIRRYAGDPVRSRVLEERTAHNEYGAVVDAAGGDERLLLKASYYPYWSATVDGVDEPVDLVAPNLMAISVPAGQHEIRFRFHDPLYMKLVFAAAVALALAAAATRRLS